MGFFDLKVQCAICENDVGLNRYQLKKNVWICPNCLAKAGGISQFATIKNLSIDEIKNRINELEKQNNENMERINEFNPTKKIGNYFWVDEIKEQWVIPDGIFSGKIKKAKIFIQMLLILN